MNCQQRPVSCAGLRFPGEGSPRGSRKRQNARRSLSGRLLRESRERFRDYSQDPQVEGFTTFGSPLDVGDS
jgi:hypothetical protein